MKFLYLFLVLTIVQVHIFSQYNPQYDENKTPTYYEVINTYKYLADNYKQAKLFTEGKSDIGKPLHLFVLSLDGDFNPESLKKKNKRIILINNGIHPGESCGIDASLQFATDILTGKLKAKKYLQNTVICIIPVYNLGGALNRGYSRMNQSGPVEHGFRGNGKNLDLNRDFIKCDSENAKSFERIFQKWNPDIFIDTHTSNGADYQYKITLIATQTDKLNSVLSEYMDNTMVPYLYKSMKKSNYEMIPYVQTMGRTPDDGIFAFYDSPRYASGYTALFNTIGFTTETHMLKPYKDRVLSTYHFIINLTEFVNKNYKEIGKTRQKAFENTINRSEFPIKWVLDKNKDSTLLFKGYTAKYKTSEITGMQRLYYDRNEPYEKQIKYYHHYKTVKSIQKPEYYIIPQAWKRVIERLKLNNIQITQLTNDTILKVTAYYIDDFSTRDLYEAHYLHYNIKTHKNTENIQFYKGDYIVKPNQKGNYYIIATLEPDADDSFFAWNFFDAILQHKEWISDYIFEETAFKILKEHPEIKEKLKQAKKEDSNLAKSHYYQLFFIYQHSDFFEKSYRRYPVCRKESNN
ncbi:MAG: hypothetical protein L3J74_10325 [Bacteroidales bacterium]|nr:hypothetical protein [Bacteroidales bacterium]